MPDKPKILVSACLLGEPVRYDGQSNSLNDQMLDNLDQQNRIVAFGPEVSGGLATPRERAEILSLRVFTESGKDVTEAVDELDQLDQR